jgi:predicted lipid-binding transport protein (Tim44 family)
MKILIATLGLLAMIAAPAFAQSTRQRATRAGGQGYVAPTPTTVPDGRANRAGRTGQSYEGTYKGYPLSEWHRLDRY